eukprot:1755463-Pyramimonas_sp.AAC.1
MCARAELATTLPLPRIVPPGVRRPCRCSTRWRRRCELRHRHGLSHVRRRARCVNPLGLLTEVRLLRGA